MEEAWLNAIPKVELHLHLEGAIPLDALWELVQKHGGDEEVSSIEELQAKFQYKSFPDFIDTWNWKNGFLREYEDFSFISERVARDLAEQNIRYAEVFFSPPDFERHGLEAQKLTEAIRAGLDREKTRIEVNLIGDVVRDKGPERAVVTVERLVEVRDQGVIGIGMGGSEHEHPPEPFAHVYEVAREHGFHTTAHAGEAAGAESVWGALRTLQVERIGHGTRATEDPELVAYLKEHRIPVEMCPISNVRTGVIETIEEHPIKQFFDDGILVSVNTDDPKMFNNPLSEEFRALHERLGFTEVDIIQLGLNAVDSSWASELTKARLRKELTEYS